jgi:RHS repeat-associated protein
VLGRLTSDQVQTLGSGVDATVRRLDTAYDTGGRPYLFTSFGDVAGTVTLNQVQRSFNGLGQLTKEYQAHGGTVNTGTTLNAQYGYSVVSSTANYSRPTNMTYPNGRVLDYVYNGNTGQTIDWSGVDNRISRLSYLADDVAGTATTHLEEYTNLGLDTVVQRAHPEPGVNLTYMAPGGPNDANDQYTGLDRFGRVVDQAWRVGSTSTYNDRFQMGYDRDSNALYKKNLVNGTFSELYHANGAGNGYDGLNQLTNFGRGILNGTNDTIGGTVTRTQSWTLDAMGNWSSIATTINGGTPSMQTRAHNAQNQITRVNGAAGPAYDNNGNMLVDENGQRYSFDAWNRLVTVKSSAGATQETYAYDAVGRRIQENVVVGGPNRDLYYNPAWQVIEERESNNTLVRSQQVWDPLAPDTLVLRDRDVYGTGTMSERLYVQQDANGNVTAVINTAGTVQERYIEDPYGQPSYLTAGWQPQGGPLCQAGVSCVKWVYLHQGGRYDPTTGLFNFRNRDYSPTLGRWTRVDPLGYNAGDTNLYRTVGNNPTNWIDPSGLMGVDPTGTIWFNPDPDPRSLLKAIYPKTWWARTPKAGDCPRIGGQATAEEALSDASHVILEDFPKHMLKEGSQAAMMMLPTPGVGSIFKVGKVLVMAVYKEGQKVLINVATKKAVTIVSKGISKVLPSSVSRVANLTQKEIAALIQSSGGNTVKIFTNQTRAPQIGRQLSGALEQKLAQAVPREGQMFVGEIPQDFFMRLKLEGHISFATT